jgi:transglutaminase-like putative cysteine protease
MLLSIRHETIYRYTAALTYTIQQLRLSPRPDPHQQVRTWEVRTAGRRNEFVDAYGNIGHMLTITGLHDDVRILARGTVSVDPLDRGRLPGTSILSPLVFTVPTRLTQPNDVITEFAMRNLQPNARPATLLGLADAIRTSVDYRAGATEVTTSAADALRLGQGVCQDHAHLFLSCCHVHGIPARYVSGYIDPGETEHAASHAWVDVWVEEVDFSGWISIDVTHACLAGETHCRLATGRDYDSAAPVRGVRHGGGIESLQVHVDVSPILS